MYRLAPITTALALALAAAPPALAQDHGNGKGGGKHEGGAHGAQDRGERGGGNDNRGQGRDDAPGRGQARGAERPDGPAARAVEAVRDRREDRRDDREDRREDRRDDRQDDRREIRREAARQVFQTRDGQPVVYFRRDDDRGLIAGCPPGLARKNNGCLPPGQARRIAAADRYDWLWRTRGDDYRYRYDNGYLYRMNSQGSLLGWLPVLGGALAPGATWPSQYAYQPAPAYYSSYYGLPQGRDYRYADGALYGVDPQTQRISQIAALLTGQNLNVGQPLPPGYDVYNVPYAYRGQYVDGPDAMYRYNDGYLYQADPTTRLVTAVIQLLT
ncbi:hypothetical protein [Brevundimonas sp.]|uniref:hypothetical protein n=1 Tax=Brevundimonas sp. TaxID=1871086 RepID=UPI002737974B|nr:hypothetical protein [Brevundimonas sp.]MDP3803403.1 hypothetical protein [Brevundimonas sp.]